MDTLAAPPGVKRLSRRDAKKAETKQALIDAALNLFSSTGYEETSVESIAEKAGVSTRTFFRYFPSKEEVLFFGEYDYIRSFAGVYLAQPPTIPELAAIEASFLVLAPALSRIKKRIDLYNRAISSSALLRGRERAHHLDSEAAIAHALAARRGLNHPDDRCRMVAVVCFALLRHSLDRWLSTADSDPRSFIQDDFASLRGVTRETSSDSNTVTHVP